MTIKTKNGKRYSTRFKQQVVVEYLSGQESKFSIAEKYSITGSSTIDRWCRQFGGDYFRQGLYIDLPLSENKISKVEEKTQPTDDVQVLRQRILELETQLRVSELKKEAYERAIEIAKRDYNIDVLKKSDTKRSPK